MADSNVNVTSSTIVLRHRDAIGNNFTENLVANPKKINVNMDSETAIAVDTFLRQVMALSTNTYKDVVITQSVDLYDLMYPDGGEDNG